MNPHENAPAAQERATRTDRIQIAEEVDEIYTSLSQGMNREPDRELTPFPTKKDVFMFAAALGYERGVRERLPSGKKVTIRREVLSRDDEAVLKAIAIASTSDVKVLERFEDVLSEVEEFAHAGIRELQAYLVDQSGQPLWNLVDLVVSARAS